jgi:hypothetical protein
MGGLMLSLVCLHLVFDLCSALSWDAVDGMKASIRELIPAEGDKARMDVLGAMLRLPFHDAFGSGMLMDGCLDPTEKDHNGLPSLREILDPVCSAHATVLSRADCWALAGNVAIKAAGGPDIPFRYGRKDCPSENEVRDQHLPSALPGGNPWLHVKKVFHTRAGLSIRDTVAVMGAHALGRPGSDEESTSGFSALPWSKPSSTTFLIIIQHILI